MLQNVMEIFSVKEWCDLENRSGFIQGHWTTYFQLCKVISFYISSSIILVLSASNILRNSDGITPCRSAKYRWGIKIPRFSTNKSLYPITGAFKITSQQLSHATSHYHQRTHETVISHTSFRPCKAVAGRPTEILNLQLRPIQRHP